MFANSTNCQIMVAVRQLDVGLLICGCARTALGMWKELPPYRVLPPDTLSAEVATVAVIAGEQLAGQLATAPAMKGADLRKLCALAGCKSVYEMERVARLVYVSRSKGFYAVTPTRRVVLRREVRHEHLAAYKMSVDTTELSALGELIIKAFDRCE